ncbi:unnamed protein product [Porites evermanni]|uniref:7TM GPCR serpentine receptor class x (Srx) domain-containing protein n=1 Tax=Porites evermanni TaxID=104178 RepID=A0ABN8QD55_9CNID|nr:unnamed protein product [Porites evermanni]
MASYEVKQNLFLGVATILNTLVTALVNLVAAYYLLIYKKSTFSRKQYNNFLMGLQAVMGIFLPLTAYTWTAVAHLAALAILPLLLKSVELTKHPIAVCLYSLNSKSNGEARVMLIYHANWRSIYFDLFAFGLSTVDPFVHPITCILVSRRYRAGYADAFKDIVSRIRGWICSFKPRTRVDPLDYTPSVSNTYNSGLIHFT